MQLFAPATYSTFGTQPHPNEGLFFSFDYMMWSISKPETATIGSPGHERTVWSGPSDDDSFRQGSTHTTGMFTANFTNGQRYEIGRMFKRHGWMFSAYHLNSQTHNILTGAMDVAFVDHAWGDGGWDHLDGNVDAEGNVLIRALPVTFASAKIHNRVRTWGLELDYIVRSRQMHKGGFFEMSLGVRYLEFNEDFSVEADGRRVLPEGEEEDDEAADSIEGTLADSFWAADANNHIVGPQIGLRYFHQYKRWTLSTEGKVFAGFNSQNIYQQCRLGTEVNSPDHIGLRPLTAESMPWSDAHSRTIHEFTPGIELRMQFDWQVTRHMSLGVGWTGLYLGGIARPSNMIAYELGSDASESSFMGILAEHNRQDVFVNGVNFRIVFNR